MTWAAPPPAEEAALFASLLSPIQCSDIDQVQSVCRQSRAQDDFKFRKVLNQTDHDGFRLLHRACSMGNISICRELLLSGADPNALTAGGDSALHWACFTGNYAVTELLLKHGADPLLASAADGKTPLDACLEEKHGHILQLFFTAPWKSLFTSSQVPCADSILYRGTLKIKLSTTAKTCQMVLSLLCRTVFLFYEAGGAFDSIKFDEILAVKRSTKSKDRFVVYVRLAAKYASRQFFSGEEDSGDLFDDESTKRLLQSSSKHLSSSSSRFSFKRSSASLTSNSSSTFSLSNQQAGGEEPKLVLALHCYSSGSQDRWVEKLREAGLLSKTLAAVRIQSLARGFLARMLLKKQRKQQQLGQRVVTERTTTAATSGRFVALDAEYTPVPSTSPAAITTNGVSSSAALTTTTSAVNPLLSSFRRSNSSSSKRMLLRNGSSSFSFRSASSGGSSASNNTLAHTVDEAFHNFEDISGFLKKRSETGVSAQLRLWKLRFAVLSHTKAQLQYYDHTKHSTKRKIKRIDFSSMLSVTKLVGSKHAFVIRLVGGTTYRFEAMDDADCKRWFDALKAVLPRDNVAALEIQRVVRGHFARKRAREMKLLLHKKQQQYVQDELGRIELARQRSFAEHVKRQEAEEDAQRKLDQLEAEAFARRQAEKRKALAKTVALPAHWKCFVDANTGKLYYYNKKTKQTSWKLPIVAPQATEEEQEDPWKEYFDETTQRKYFVHAETNESSWTKPAAVSLVDGEPVVPAATAAASWKRHLDPKTQKYFYMNEKTGERSWTKPTVPEHQAWTSLVDPDTQREYFSNMVTGESVWVLPVEHSVYQQNDMEDAMVKHLEYLVGEHGTQQKIDDLEQAVLTSGGLLLCKALERIDPDAVDRRVFDKHHYHGAASYWNLLINALRRTTVVAATFSPTMSETNNNVLDLVWEVLKLDLLVPVSILSFPGLLEYKLDTESVHEFHVNVPPETKLMRWLGITSWYDGQSALAKKLELEVESDVFAHCQRLGVPLYCSNPVRNDPRYIFACSAIVFRAFPPSQEFSILGDAQLDLLQDQERQEFVLHNWLGLDASRSLYQHLRDGVVLIDLLLGLLDGNQQLDKHVVVHPRYSEQKEGWLENAYIVMELAQQVFPDPPPRLTPSDLVEGNAKPILSFLYQCVAASRHRHGAAATDESRVLDWANQTVKRFLAAQQQQSQLVDRKNTPSKSSVKFIERPLVQQENTGEEVALQQPPVTPLKSALLRRSQSPLPCKDISSFRDRTLATGCFLLCLLQATVLCKEGNAGVNWKHMVDLANVDLKSQHGQEACIGNAKYLVSLAYKALPPPVLLAWEDVVQVKPKPIFSFVAALMDVDRV